MRYLRSLVNSVVLVGLLLLIFIREARAYIDPGTGSYILQLILAALLGAFFAIKISWKKIRTSFVNLFSKRQKDKENNE